VAWTELKGVPEVPSPLLYRNRLYYVKNGGVLTCRDPKTGKAIFEERLDAPGGYYASPVAADGKIYTASDRGMVVVLEAADTLRVLARNELKEPIMATPAIVDNKLYVRTDNQLYAFGR
jgi:outer membrane protein assembly factor BamB